jgi:predicted glycosyltransferase
MKIYAVLRGFPGLGRVIAGVEILKYFESNYNAEVKISTYWQGAEYISTKGYASSIIVDEKDISNIGLISVSKSGELVIEDILDFNPDILLIDGEPILLHNIKISYPHLLIVSLLNPFDINNKHNRKSSQDFFKSMFSHADVSIVHGLWKEEKPFGFKQYASINSIVRDTISEISISNNSNSIVCLLGGGSKSVNSGFTSGTIEIAKQVVDIALLNPDNRFKIYTSDQRVKNEILEYKRSCLHNHENISVIGNITDEKDIYAEARLVIARAGRNTISELLTMNMPSIIIPTTANFRGSEQMYNCKRIESLNNPNIKTHYLEFGSNSLNEKVLSLINSSFNNYESGLIPGNNTASEIILSEIRNYTPDIQFEFDNQVNINNN